MKNELRITGGDTYNDSHIYGGVEFSQEVNPDTDIQYGICAVGELNFTLDVKLPRGTEVTWFCQMMGEDAKSQRGIFTVENVEMKSPGKYSHTCYDAMYKLDVDCTRWFKQWLAGETNKDGIFVLGVASFRTSKLMKAVTDEFCDISFGISPEPPNYNTQLSMYEFLRLNGWISNEMTYETPVPINADDITMPAVTARQLLSWLCEFCGVFAQATRTGTIILRPFQKPRISDTEFADVHVPYTSRREKTMNIADYDCPKISAVCIENYGDTQYAPSSASSSANLYSVRDNPFFINNSSYARNLYEYIKELQGTDGKMYRPVTMQLFNDMGINTSGTYTTLNCGDIFTYDGISSSASVKEAVVKESGGEMLNEETFVTGSSGYTVSNDGKYSLSGTMYLAKPVTELVNKPFYCVSNEIGDFRDANYMTGKYLYTVTYYNVGAVVYTVKQMVSKPEYEKHIGIVMRKKITPKGVEIECTGGETRGVNRTTSPVSSVGGSGGGGGGAGTETDPTVPEHVKDITNEEILAWDQKVNPTDRITNSEIDAICTF